MEFRLTYNGLLLATQGDTPLQQHDRSAEHKHHIRKYFHGQLKRLWQVTPFLHEFGGQIRTSASSGGQAHDIQSAEHIGRSVQINAVENTPQD
jgi:hypothetical protein